MKWQTTPLGEVASLERRSLLPEEIESGTNYLGLEHIESGGRILAYQKVEPGELQSNKFIFDSGTLLYGKLRPYLAKVCIPDREGCCSTDILPIRPSEKLDIGYLKHLLLWKPYVDKATSLCAGANLPRISPSSLLGIEIPLPPLEEQRRIAAILDKANNIHALAAGKARSSAAALYRSLLTQELDQPEVEWVQLGDALEIARGGSPRPIQAYLTDNPDGINWIMIGDAGVGEKYIANTAKKIRAEGLSKTRVVKEGDLLLSNSMSFGRPYIMKTNGAIHDGWLVLRDAHAMCSSDYLYHVLGSPMCYAQFARAAAGATVKNLNTSIVSSIEIPLPPLESQVEIAARLDAVELHVGRKFALLAHVAEQLKSSLTGSLMQVAV
jgi:type I restriction enzyme S subunit